MYASVCIRLALGVGVSGRPVKRMRRGGSVEEEAVEGVAAYDDGDGDGDCDDDGGDGDDDDGSGGGSGASPRQHSRHPLHRPLQNRRSHSTISDQAPSLRKLWTATMLSTASSGVSV